MLSSKVSRTYSKFRVGFLIVTTILSLLIVICLFSLRGISEARNIQAEGDDYMQFSLDLMILRNNLSRQRVLVREMILVNNRAQFAGRHQIIRELSSRNEILLKSMAAHSSHTPELQTSLRQIEALYRSLEKTRNERVIPAIYAGRLAEAEAISLGQQNLNVMRLRAIADPLLENALERHLLRVTVAYAHFESSVRFLYLMLIVVTVSMCITIIYVSLSPPARDVAE